MELKTTMRLNPRTTIELIADGKDLEEAISKSMPLLDFGGKCGMCGSEDITLKITRSGDGKFTYTKYVCNDCGGEQAFGKRQADGGLFLKEWKPKYQGSQGQ